jgi:MFS family permease
VEPAVASVEARRPAPTGPAEAIRLIRSREFGPYFVGNAFSAIGMWFQNLAAAIFVWRLTHSVLLLGVLNFAQFVPVLVLAPWVGSAADRFDRRRLLLTVQLAAAGLTAVLAVLTWLDLASAPIVILFGLGNGVAMAFTTPTASALIASLVSREELASAVGLNAMTYNLARALGPTLAAPCVRFLGVASSFAINSGSYLVLAAALTMLAPRSHVAAARSESRLRDMLPVLRARRQLLSYLLVGAVASIATDPVNTEPVAFARLFDRPDAEGGFFIGAFGAGGVTAALLFSGRVAGGRKRLAGTVSLLAVGMLAFAAVPWFWLVWVPLFAAGFGYLAAVTSASSRLQLEVTDQQRGRMMAVWAVAFLGSRPLASLLDGAIAHAVGVRWAAFVLAMPAAAAVFALSPYRKHHPR